MKRIASISLKVILTLVILGVIAVAALSYFINPERLKPIVISKVEQQYNRVLQIGDMRWRVFPRLGISISDVSLSNNPAFGDGVFAAFQNVTIFVDTLSLLRGHVDVKTMLLADAKADLKVNKAGTSNWGDLLVAEPENETTPAADDTKTQEADGDDGSAFGNFSFNIESIEIKDAAFTYEDEKSGEAYEITNLNFSSKNVALNKDFPMNASFDLNANSPEIKADISANATMYIPASKDNEINIEGVKVNGEVNIGKLVAEGMTITQFKAPVNAADGIIDMSPVTAKLYGGTFNGAVKINTQQDPASIFVAYDLRNTQIGSMLKDLNGQQNFTGSLNLKGDLSFRSHPGKKQLTSSLNGKADLYIGRGTLHGLDLPYWYAFGNNLLNPGSVSQPPSTGNTEFVKTTAHFSIRNGVITNKDLVLVSPTIYGAGAGTINLVSDKVDYRFQLQGIRHEGDDYYPAGAVIPLIISGSLSDPNISPDVGELVKDQVIQGIGRQLLQGLGR